MPEVETDLSQSASDAQSKPEVENTLNEKGQTLSRNRNCPCGSNKAFSECCGPIIAGKKFAETAEALLRARYSAHVRIMPEFVLATMMPGQRQRRKLKMIRDWASSTKWDGLDIQEVKAGENPDQCLITFSAWYKEFGERKEHKETAKFNRIDGQWFFDDGEAGNIKPIVLDETTRQPDRNAPCHCGSGIKYKKCCLNKDLEKANKPAF